MKKENFILSFIVQSISGLVTYAEEGFVELG